MQKYQPDHWQLGSGLPNMVALGRREFVVGGGQYRLGERSGLSVMSSYRRGARFERR